MIIKNITGSGKNAAKVIGIGNGIVLQPDEEKMVPDSVAYVDEFDDEKRPTGKKVILPALQVQKKMGMIEIRETAPANAPERAPARPAEAAPAYVEERQAEDEEARKKAEAAAKRAATRAANKAAKESAAG